MPREVFHWYVLDRAANSLDEDSCLKKTIEENKTTAQLGAIAHDSAYYLDGGRSKLDRLASALHGSYPGDPLFPLLKALDYLDRLDSPESRQVALSFIVGMLSHSVTDISLHPFVFYFTGEYHDPDTKKRLLAQQRHRILEVYLDMWVVAEMKGSWKSFSIANRLKTSRSLRGLIVSMFEQAVIPGIREEFPELALDFPSANDQQNAESLYAGIEEMAFYQRLFLSRIVGSIARLLKLIAPSRFGPLEALFLSGRCRNFDKVFTKAFEIHNPITNELSTASIRELSEQAIELTREVLLTLEPICDGGAYDKERLLELLSRRSLNYGLVDTPLGSSKHFSSKGIDLPDLRF